MKLSRYGGLLAAVALSCAWHTAAWAQDSANARSGGGHTSIADNGSTIEADGAEAATGSVSPGFAGSARELAPGQTDDSQANIRSGQESEADLRALLTARPMTAPVGVETIIGPDNRVRVNPTTTYPARATVLITFSTPGGNSRCTGWLINRNTVATAGHCVHRGSGGASGFFPRASYRIYPGRNGNASPFGSCTAGILFTVEGWAVDGNEQFDYGAIKLNCNVGNTTGWYGYFFQNGSFNGERLITQGYPGDKPLTQWQSRGTVTATSVRQVFYNADTLGGQSGSPVYQNISRCGPCGLAIHAYGLHGSGPHANSNHGTRITRQVFRNLGAWQRAR